MSAVQDERLHRKENDSHLPSYPEKGLCSECIEAFALKAGLQLMIFTCGLLAAQGQLKDSILGIWRVKKIALRHTVPGRLHCQKIRQPWLVGKSHNEVIR